MLSIPGVAVVAVLYESVNSLVYRAIREADKKPIILKLLKESYPTPQELVRYRTEYRITQELKEPGVVRVYDLQKYQNSLVMFVEDFGGESLKVWMQERKFSLKEFLQIAIATTEILGQIHSANIIHKDINPSNIVYNPETEQLKIIDFGISTQLIRETPILKNPGILEGTLAYISPEQTGRMNRALDYRTDFYSLGVTFYELLTGQVPFDTEDALELVHCHIARQPVPPHEIEPVIPLIVSQIVSKLMAKNAENRYQTALGLKQDLETCLFQLQATANIETFALGTRDLTDRFLIPEKLYGRETEVSNLLSAFERVSTGSAEMILVAGFSGIGKTAVVNEVHKPIARQRGYFIKGKYDQFGRNIPFSAFVQAFRELMGQLLSESDAQLQTWKTNILTALGDSGQVLIEVIPELERIIGAQPLALELSGMAAQNRFNLLMQKFVQVLTTVEHPLVIFLDDLQWADGASLKLLQLLMEDTGHLLVLGAYRDNEVSQSHPFMLTLDEIVKSGATVNTITLQPLSLADLNQLVADTLICDLSFAQPLTELVYEKTKGNPFFSTQFLKALYEDGLIIFDRPVSPTPLSSPLTKGGQRGVQGGWQCDIARVTFAEASDVVEFMAVQLQKLPKETQNVLKLAACIGGQFDLDTLALVSEEVAEPTASVLWKALLEGVILVSAEGYNFIQADAQSPHQSVANPTYKFLHDRVQQAAYSLIPDDQKQATHLKIGRLLLQNSSDIEREEKLFDIVGHLNQAIELINQLSEREALAKLNLEAGGKARSSTAYAAAMVYLQTGIELLTANCWQSQYELTLNLYIAAAEAAYLNADIEGMEHKAALVLQEAKTILDRVKIYEISIAAQTAQGKMLEAIAVGRNALLQLGVEFPTEPDEALISKALQTLKSQLQGRQIEELVDLPVMTNSQTQAAMQMLGMLPGPIFMGKSGLLPLLSSTMVSLSLSFGNAPASTVGYAMHGMVFCAFLQEVETGYGFGQLALSLLDRFNVLEFKSIILLLFGGWIQHRQEAILATIPTLKEGYRLGMETGDFVGAGYNICHYFSNKFFSGIELDIWEPEIVGYRAVLAQVKQYPAQDFLDIIQQTVWNLRETRIRSGCLIGTAYDETVMIPKQHQDNNLSAIAVAYIYKLLLAYSFSNYTAALDYLAQGKQYLIAVSGLAFVPIFHFYAALTHLALFPTRPEIEQAQILAEVEIHQTTLKQWAQNAPMNYLHKWYLVEAERQRVLGNKAEAIDLYERAISLAKENQFLNEEALANELAAKFYLEWDKEKFAQLYMIEAYYCYIQWGATAKVKDLETRSPHLLKPIQAGRNNTKTTATVTTTGLANNLDITTVMKATTAISGEILLDKLLSNLMKILIENAGAEIGYLILSSQGKLLIEAEGAINSEQMTILQSIPVEYCQELSSAIVNYVARTQESVVLDDATRSGQFTNDPYIQKNQPKSILCVPLIYQSQIVSIVYLENNLTAGAFTPERVELLKVLSGQAAISIQNSKLYTEVRESENRLTQFLEAIPVGVSVLDASGKPYYSNRAAIQLLGKGVIPEVTSEQIPEVYQLYQAGTEQEYPSAELPAVRALRGESATVDDMEIHQGNEIIPIEAWGTPIYDEKDNISYAIVAFQDITERKKAETERIRFTDELFQLNKAYERFVPNQFLHFLEKLSIVDVELGDQVQLEMSVLFSDIRDFTTLSETMTPEDNFKFINSYLSRMEPVINENHGFIDKYIGDAIMALFSGEADRAVKAGIAMLHRLVEYNQHRANFGCAPIQIGIGINTGTLMLGTVGGQNRMDGTVISDAVNLASRVESLTKNYGVSLLITQPTYSRLKNPSQYAIRTLDTVKVKGKSEAVTIYEVFDADTPEIKAGKLATLQLFAEALEIYSEGKLAEAGRLFANCWRENPGDAVAKIYWERCQSTLRNRTKIKDTPHDLD
ncbi:adenylate/guanylate cyclase with GAF and PAS/PAC sensors [Oscillatoria nigro-viridis PCC 7112]|uniref:Adenylate/guanylate cyclase with GAF and PAS/PAC sensors n=1 Tax=Phormidium nigroviride PCC 7112 TaxID=179408 RepID=K9VPC2_9CYAN|nr:AAA family ATPase [Oscillatoria nigro-viridis]AFZ09943.1 adenylate/guanylate cyclase with GAF and PAS/PAC sensors [Oscillatoria nigro-viridis PCC 7112]